MKLKEEQRIPASNADAFNTQNMWRFWELFTVCEIAAMGLGLNSKLPERHLNGKDKI